MSFIFAHHLTHHADAESKSIRAVSCDLAHMDAIVQQCLDNEAFKLIAVRTQLNLRDQVIPADIIHALPVLGSLGAALHIALNSSDRYDQASAPRALPAAALLITSIARQAGVHRVKVALSPRQSCWMERIEDAVRLAMRVNRSDVGVVFNYSDWHRIDGDINLLSQRIKLALPKLMAVTWPATLKNNPSTLIPLTKLLITGGYKGPVILEADQP